MEEISSKWSSPEITVDLAVKLTEFMMEFDGDGDGDLDLDLSTEFPVKEEMIEEVMQELYKEITCPTSPPENISSLPQSHSPSLSPFSGSEGKSESCGASVSDLASTVMAGIEFVGPTGKLASPEENGRRMVKGGGGGGCERGTDGCDGGEVDDEWLTRVLGNWDPQEFIDQWIAA